MGYLELNWIKLCKIAKRKINKKMSMKSSVWWRNLTKCAWWKNRHMNLSDACVILNNEKSLMRDKISKLKNYNMLVLNNCAAAFCEKWCSNSSEMWLLILLLICCDEYIIRKFLIKHHDKDPGVYFGIFFLLVLGLNHKRCEYWVAYRIMNVYSRISAVICLMLS